MGDVKSGSIDKNPERYDLLMLKEELRQNEKATSRNNELLFELNSKLDEVLKKLQLLSALGNFAGGFLKGGQ